MSTSILPTSSTFIYFDRQLERSLDQRDLCLSPDARWYLAKLLEEYGDPTRLCAADGTRLTLAELLAQARQGPPSQAVGRYQRLGDHALVMSGAFRRALLRSQVGMGYYLRMGRTAYGALEQLLRSRGPQMAALFQELALTYEACSDLLLDVAGQHLGAWQQRDIVRLYTSWLCTGEDWLADQLAAAGVPCVVAAG